MDEQSVKGKVGVGQAAARGFVATALTLSLVPSLAYASPDNEEEAPATNEKTSSEAGTTSNNNDNAVSLASAVSKAASSYDLAKIADGTYEGTAEIGEDGLTIDGEDSGVDDGDEFDGYTLKVAVTVADHAITKVEVLSEAPSESTSYQNKAVNGVPKKNIAGVPDQIISGNGTGDIDAVSGATVTSKAIVAATNSALQVAYDDQSKQVEDEYTYGYAGLTWAEYWAAEGVYNADNVQSSTEADSRGEYDKGGYDVVSRATVNHGLHRGSYQCIATIKCTDGAEFQVSSWADDGKAFTTTDGKIVEWSKGTMTYNGQSYTMEHYEVSGIKYVPVKVKTSELNDFKAQYQFVENGGTLTGGYSEKNLQAYSLTASVDASTNGLKEATKSGDSFAFAKAATGAGSGIEGAELQTADLSAMGPDLKSGDGIGSFGEFIRLDFTENYGDLGSKMQSVTWDYYGDVDPASAGAAPKASFGTKFAADNWMHKQIGIQLGLTDSYRCQLPEGTDGTGYWKVTIHALGYADSSYTFQATSDNIKQEETPVSEETKASLQELVDKAKALNESSYTAESWAAMKVELDESEEFLAKTDLTESAASEQIEHLQAAIDALVKVSPEAGDYVLMNIPYSDFYANETPNNSTKVDVFTSATKNKTKGSLAAGTYHTEDGSEITGVTFAVKVTESATGIDWSQYTRVENSDALATAGSYSYVVLDEAPASYKELSLVDGNVSFGKTAGAEATVIDGSSEAEFTTESGYGDYELDFAASSSVYAVLKDATIYGAVVDTTDGTGYGMRSLENIWKTGKHGFELAWCTGFTDTVHGCITYPEHYKTIMGKTLKDVVVYTSAGTYRITLGENGIYVPVKTADAQVTVGEVDLDASDPVVNAEVSLPADFDASYKIDGEDATRLLGSEGSVSFSAKGMTPGEHVLTVADKSGKYADLNIDFVASTSKQVASFDDAAAKVVAANDVSEVDFANYLSNIESVKVNDESYAAWGRGAAKIISADGAINTEATSGMGDAAKKVFGSYGAYEIEVTATGYTTNLTFTYNYEADKTALKNAIDSVSELKETDYSQASWANLQEAVANGNEVLNAVSATDDAVASAVQAINDAKAALEANPRIALNELIDNAEQLTQTDYTKASWKVLDAALQDAKAVAADSTATDAQVTDAKDALVKAQTNLDKAATTDQKTDLKVEIGKADALKESDYTAESWAAYQQALKAAVEVVNGEDLSADEVSQALSQLQKARTALVAANEDSENNGGATNNVTNNVTSNTTNSGSDFGKSGSAKTGDSTVAVAGGFGAIAAAAAAVAAWTRRRILRK